MVKRIICTCLVQMQITSSDQDTEKSLTDAIAITHCRRSTEPLIRKHTGILQYFTEVNLWMRKKTPCTTRVDCWQMSNGSCPTVSISKGRWGHEGRSEECFKVKREESEGWVVGLSETKSETWEVVWKRRWEVFYRKWSKGRLGQRTDQGF